MRLFLFSLPLLSLVACTGASADSFETDDSAADDTAATFDDSALASALWSATAGYEGWTLPEGWTSTPVLSGNHMGAYVVAYFNETLAGWDGTGEAPDGAISVKENFGDAEGTTLMNLTVMQKVAGYDGSHGDWFWAEYNPDGSVAMAGQVDMCSSCHASAPHDYVYADPPTGM